MFPPLVASRTRARDPLGWDDLLIPHFTIIQQKLAKTGEVTCSDAHTSAKVREPRGIQDDITVVLRAQLLLNDGKVGDEQVVPAEWVSGTR
ncbi:MAG: hypothetical protein AAFO83_13955, partial [Cyanobacteria bacterium J06607_13]